MKAEGVNISWIYSVALNPLPDDILAALKGKDLVLVPELNYQGQWSGLLRQDGINAISITQYTGLPFRPGDLAEQIKKKMSVTEKVGAAR